MKKSLIAKEIGHKGLASLPFSRKLRMVIANQRIMESFRRARQKRK